jgi:hypothetical protein
MEDQNQDRPAQPGIVEQLVRDDSDRKRFLKMVGGAGAASFGAFVIAACGSSSKSSSSSSSSAASSTPSSSASTSTSAAPSAAGGTTVPSSFGTGDLGILNYALTLEYLETAFYAAVVAKGLFTGPTGALVKTFGMEESEHVSALTAAIKGAGGTPAKKPATKFSLSSAGAVAQLAYTVENLGAGAYLAQAPNIKSPEVLAAALSIHSVEARHAATLATLVHGHVTPDGAFAKPIPPATVLAAVKPFLA